MAGIPGVTAFPESDNLLSWVGTIEVIITKKKKNLNYYFNKYIYL